MGFTVLSFALAPHLGQDFFPSVDGGQIKMHVRAQTGTRIELPQYPGRKFDATRVTTSNAMSATSRSMQVELQADNSDGKLLGNTYCEHGARTSHGLDAGQPGCANRGSWRWQQGGAQVRPTRPRFRRQLRGNGRPGSAGSSGRQPARAIANGRYASAGDPDTAVDFDTARVAAGADPKEFPNGRPDG